MSVDLDEVVDGKKLSSAALYFTQIMSSLEALASVRDVWVCTRVADVSAVSQQGVRRAGVPDRIQRTQKRPFVVFKINKSFILFFSFGKL